MNPYEPPPDDFDAGNRRVSIHGLRMMVRITFGALLFGPVLLAILIGALLGLARSMASLF